MVISEALDRVISATGHARYRDLCDPMHADYDPGYVELVIVLASGSHPVKARQTGIPPSRMALPETLAIVRGIKSCPHRVKASCGCMPDRCRLGKGDQGLVSFGDCARCISGRGS